MDYEYYLCQYMLRPQNLYIQTEDTLRSTGLPEVEYIIALDETEKTAGLLLQYLLLSIFQYILDF